MRWFFSVWIIGLTIYCLVRMRREVKHLTKVKRPHQLVELVQQAHQAGRIKTEFDIHVSERMRDALCAPLTQEQLATIRSAAPGTYSTYVKCELLSSTYKGDVLSGVVKSAVRVKSKFSEEPLVCPEVQLKITVSGNGKSYIAHRWEVTSVEQIA